MNAHHSKSELAFQLGELLESLKGETVIIEEWITRDRNRGYDRHFSIFNKFQFVVEKVMWQMSGGNFYLYGKDPIQYSFLTGELSGIENKNNELVIVEQYEDKTERKTIIRHMQSHYE